ncbi:AraC family transcriptional regulator [Acidocella sp.]|uniref:AraC family transcriptional regulator n=1 Tax=Acidocella sp. TaxID=50710 RepID=UPI003CFE49A5
MVWNSRIEFLEDVARPLLALGTDYKNGHEIPAHKHRRHQLLFSAAGTVIVTTLGGSWVIPPGQGIWIPAGVEHAVKMLGEVPMRSLYLDPTAISDMPEDCQVMAIPAFMQGLMREALDIPAEYELSSRAAALMTLLLHELHRLSSLPLGLPMPTGHHPLLTRCQNFLKAPTPHATIDEWATSLGLSRRAFTRLFRRETGQSFAVWRQHACLHAALPRLGAGESVTQVALDLGYDNPAAFTAMFKRCLGVPPRHYLRRGDEHS